MVLGGGRNYFFSSVAPEGLLKATLVKFNPRETPSHKNNTNVEGALAGKRKGFGRRGKKD